MKAGIYKIVNLVNNKLYIGSSKNLIKRWYMHKWKLNKGIHHCIHLQLSYNKHGEENFKFEIIENCSLDQLILREQFYLDAIKPEYNICKIAGTTKSRILSEEHKIKIGLSNKGRKLTKEHKRQISEFMKTRVCSQETRAKMSVRSKIRVCSQETKEKISKIHKGKKLTEENKQKLINSRRKFIVIIGFNDNMCIKFQSLHEACKELKIDNSSLRKVLKGKAKTCGGYRWLYEKDLPDKK